MIDRLYVCCEYERELLFPIPDSSTLRHQSFNKANESALRNLEVNIGLRQDSVTKRRVVDRLTVLKPYA